MTNILCRDCSESYIGDENSTSSVFRLYCVKHIYSYVEKIVYGANLFKPITLHCLGTWSLAVTATTVVAIDWLADKPHLLDCTIDSKYCLAFTALIHLSLSKHWRDKALSPLCTSITPSLFHSRLKTYFFHKSYPPQFYFFLPDCLHGLLPAPFLLSYSVFILFFSLFFVFGPCARLRWPFRQLLSAH